jgi:2-polyprenyl-3-methyl-5-hydroxy-6-metoxy-1,4-benzoquinol methylase
MRRCDDCGLLFCSPRLADEGIAALYGPDYYVNFKSDASYFARTAEVYERTAMMLPTGPDRPGRVLEVGSGKGYLLAALNRLGWRATGIEIGADAARYARDVFGVETFPGTIEAYRAAYPGAHDFPTVLCIDIIEHVTDPSAFVAELASVTAKGGVLVIDTPNGGAAHIPIEKENWRGFNPFHIFVFNRENLTRLLEQRGFRVTQAFSYNNVLDRAALKAKKASEPAAATLEECVAACRASTGYRATDDAQGELAADCAGENLVVFATRV